MRGLHAWQCYEPHEGFLLPKCITAIYLALGYLSINPPSIPHTSDDILTPLLHLSPPAVRQGGLDRECEHEPAESDDHHEGVDGGELGKRPQHVLGDGENGGWGVYGY